jgi:hypothetical protein
MQVQKLICKLGKFCKEERDCVTLEGHTAGDDLFIDGTFIYQKYFKPNFTFEQFLIIFSMDTIMKNGG